MALPAFFAALAPYALNFLSSRLGAGAERGRMKAIQRMYTPEYLTNMTNKLFQNMQASPMYTAARGNAMTNASQLGNSINASFARRGLGTSGIAGVATPMAQSSFNQAFAGIDADFFKQAMGNAQTMIDRQAQNMVPGLGAGTWGRFLDSSNPMLMDLFKRMMSKYSNVDAENWWKKFGQDTPDYLPFWGSLPGPR